PDNRNSVCSGERWLRVNDSWNTLRSPAVVRTSTLRSASSTTRGTGIGTAGPARSVSCTPSNIRPCSGARDAFGLHDAEFPAHRIRQLLGQHGIVGIAQAPIQLGVPEIMGREVIRAIRFDHGMLCQQGKAL